MIISLVVFFSSTPRNGAGGGNRYGSIDGQRISDQDFANAYRETELHFFLSYGSWPEADAKRMGYDSQRETYNRLFFIQKLKEHNINPDSATVARMANNILANIGRGTPVSLDLFVDKVLKQRGIGPDDFERYIRHDLGIQQLVTVLGISGKLVTPAEAETLYIRNNQDYSASVVAFSASNYLSGVGTLAPETLAQFYTNQMSVYRIPERLQVAYVKFDVTNFLADADQQIAKLTNFSAMVDQIYLQRGTNYYKGSITADEAKAKIRGEMRHEAATTAARKKANDFASELYDLKPQRPENLSAFAQSNGLAAKISAPFDEETGPVEFDGGVNFAKFAFALTAEDPFAGPLTGGDAVFVIAPHQRIPSEIPALATIHSRVEADCKMYQASALARSKGMMFANTLTNALAQGKTFAGICSEAKVPYTTLPPFSLSTKEVPELDEQLNINQLKQITLDTPPGKASGFNPTREGGVIVFVQQRLPLDEAKMRKELPKFIDSVRQARQNEAVNFWYRREAEKALRDTPLAQPRPATGKS